MITKELETPIGGRLVVEEYGESSATPVIWLHSEFGSFGAPPLGEVLSVSRVIAPHLPGWGVSTEVRTFRRIDELALLIWWMADELNVDRGALAGHGLGGALAAEMAIQQPARVELLALASPFGIVDAADPGADIFGLTPGDLMPHLYADPAGDVAAGHYPKPADAYESGLAAIRRVQVLGSASRYVFPLPDTDVESRAYRLARVPTSIVFGGRDGVVPAAIAPRWQRAIPHASISIVKEGAHMHPYELPMFADALASSLQTPAA